MGPRKLHLILANCQPAGGAFAAAALVRETKQVEGCRAAIDM